MWSASPARPSASTRAAASSIASGIPSSRETTRATSGAFSGLTLKPGFPRRARSAKSSAAADRRTASGSPEPGSSSGDSRYHVSPPSPSCSRLVASTRTSSALLSSTAHSSATAASTCSQLSRMSSIRRGASTSASTSSGCLPGSCCTPRTDITSAVTCAASAAAPSSTSHAPSGEPVLYLTCQLGRQAGLAHAAGAGHRYEPGCLRAAWPARQRHPTGRRSSSAASRSPCGSRPAHAQPVSRKQPTGLSAPGQGGGETAPDDHFSCRGVSQLTVTSPVAIDAMAAPLRSCTRGTK